MSIVVVATIRPLEGRHDELRAAYEDVVGKVHEADQGCELYALHDGGDRLVLIEKWESADALDRHATGPTMTAMRSQVTEMVQGKSEVVVLDALPAGVPALGTI
jgi:quinol monooxygenase YgiN